MRTYVTVTGALFALLVVAHLLRGFAEPAKLGDPWFLAFTVLAAALAAWAGSLLARARKA